MSLRHAPCSHARPGAKELFTRGSVDVSAPGANRLEAQLVPINVGRQALPGAPRQLWPLDVRAVVVDHDPIRSSTLQPRRKAGVAARRKIQHQRQAILSFDPAP